MKKVSFAYEFVYNINQIKHKTSTLSPINGNSSDV